jgi:hypothetical protein
MYFGIIENQSKYFNSLIPIGRTATKANTENLFVFFFNKFYTAGKPVITNWEKEDYYHLRSCFCSCKLMLEVN